MGANRVQAISEGAAWPHDASQSSVTYQHDAPAHSTADAWLGATFSKPGCSTTYTGEHAASRC